MLCQSSLLFINIQYIYPKKTGTVLS